MCVILRDFAYRCQFSDCWRRQDTYEVSLLLVSSLFGRLMYCRDLDFMSVCNSVSVCVTF
jgi:hypothetical protein